MAAIHTQNCYKQYNRMMYVVQNQFIISVKTYIALVTRALPSSLQLFSLCIQSPNLQMRKEIANDGS